jgi:hypothetical protein
MTKIIINIPEIPHGHGLSFKKGVADGLLSCEDHEGKCHQTHSLSYQKGLNVGKEMKFEIAKLVKP